MKIYQSRPIVIVAILILIIFTVEALIMGLLYYLSPPAGLVSAVLDAILLSFLLSPLIYHFVARPLVRYAQDQIESRKQMAQEREFLASVLDSLTHPLYVIDASDYSVIMANTASGNADKTGAKCYEVTHNRSTPCNGEDLPCLLRKVKQSGQPAVAEHVHQNGNGEPSFLEIHAFPVFNSEGELKEIIEYSLDRTEHKAALAALRDSEKELLHLRESALEGIFRSSPDGQIDYANLAMARIFGFDSVEEILKINARELYFDIEDREKLMAEFEAHGQVVHQELRMRNRNGKEIWVRESARVRRDSSGKIRYYEGFLSDITQMKEAEQATQAALHDLQAAQEYAQLLVDSSLDMIISVDADRKIKEFNQAAEQAFGYHKEEVLGRSASLLYADEEEGHEMYKAAREAGHLVREITNRRKNGDTFPSLLAASRLTDKSGEFVGLMGVSRDITQTKLVEQTLVAERERLAITLRGIADSVISTDVKGNIVLINRAAKELLGCSKKQAQGRPMTKIFKTVDAETGEPVVIPFDEILTRGREVRSGTNLAVVTRKGKMLRIDYTATPLRDHESALVGVVIVFRDITAKLQLETEMLRAQRLESVGDIAGGLAHDFNNLLSSVGLNISLARLQVGNDVDVGESLRHAEHSVQMARGISKQLMLFTRGGAPEKVEIDFRPHLEESVKFALGGSRVVPEFNLPDNLWVVEIDPSQINQVIHNLAINAAQAMPEGGTLTVSGKNVEAGKIKDPSKGTYLEDNYVMITFQDTGDGIPSEILDRIFDPYFTTRKEGSGLGLFSCYTILNKHNGWIGAASLPGQGSTFTFYLPAAAGTVDRAPENEWFDLGSGRILVMDDEEAIRRVMTSLIEVLGYQVETVTDGEEAVVHYRVAQEKDEPFDAVILDLTVPAGMGGLDTVKQLRKLDPHLKAIVSSGHVTHDALENYQKYGFAGVIRKPCTGEQLSRVLVSVMAERGKKKEVLDPQA